MGQTIEPRVPRLEERPATARRAMSICATISRVIATPVRAARVVLVGLACAARILRVCEGATGVGWDAALAYHTRAWAGEPALERFHRARRGSCIPSRP